MSNLQKIEKDIDLTLRCMKHWIKNSLLEEVSIGTRSCALCKEYHGDNCEGCPIYEKTGEDVCKNTPYWEIAKHPLYKDYNLDRMRIDRTNSRELFSELSRKEVLFLNEILTDLITKKDKLRKEIDSIKVGDYVQIKKEIYIQDVIHSWPGDSTIEEVFPYTIFKVQRIEGNSFYTTGYHSFVINQKLKSNWKFAIKQFDKIEPPIPEPGDLVINLDDTYKYKIIKEMEKIEKYDDIKFYVGENVYQKKDLQLLRKDKIQVLVKNRKEDDVDIFK